MAQPGSPYRPLAENQIRVLRLLPGKHDEELCGTLEHIALPEVDKDAETSYEAISSAWGSAVKPFHIRVGGNSSISITRSLDELLRHFRFESAARDLWADGICINQEDLEERGQQVKIMARIYAGALHVLVWLGLSDDPVADAAAVEVAGVCKSMLYSDARFPGFESKKIAKVLREAQSQDRQDADEDDGCLDEEKQVLEGLATIWTWMRRNYFSRLWTVQESCSARDLFFCTDSFTLPRINLEAASYAIGFNWTFLQRKSLLTGSDEMIPLEIASTSFDAQDRADSILENFIMYCQRECADPRDRIFAIRDVLHLENVEGLQPDYNVEPADLYRTFLLHLLSAPISEWKKVSPSLIFALAGTESEFGMTRLNSWTPNLHRLSRASRAKANCYAFNTFDTRYYSGPKRPDDEFQYIPGHFSCQYDQTRPFALNVKGRIFARVVESIPLPGVPSSYQGDASFDPNDYSDFEAFQDWYGCWYQYFAEFFDSPKHQFDVHRELVHFLAYPTNWSKMHGSLRTWVGEWPYNHWERYQNSHPGHRGPPGMSTIDFQGFLMDALANCPLVRKRRGWKIAGSGRVDLAWLPETAKAGDHVCLFAGSIWPFVVRDADDGNYWLVGDCHTYSTPLIEALGGDFDGEKYGDGHWVEVSREERSLDGSGADDESNDACSFVDEVSLQGDDLDETSSTLSCAGGSNAGDDDNPQSGAPATEILDETQESNGDTHEPDVEKTAQRPVRFSRGDALGLNMRGLRYDDLIAKMGYITLV